MKKETIIPITWKGWDTVDLLVNNYYDVTFTADFGVFLVGDEFGTITVDYGNGLIEGYNIDGSVVLKSQKFIGFPQD